MQASLSLYTCSWVFFPFKIKDKFCLFWLFCTFWEKWRFMKPDASILLSPLREVILTMQNFLCWKLTLFFFTFPFFFFFFKLLWFLPYSCQFCRLCCEMLWLHSSCPKTVLCVCVLALWVPRNWRSCAPDVQLWWHCVVCLMFSYVLRWHAFFPPQSRTNMLPFWNAICWKLFIVLLAQWRRMYRLMSW